MSKKCLMKYLNLLLVFHLFSFLGCSLQPDEVNLATPPSPPLNATAQALSTNSIILTWSLPQSDGDKPITGYRIYRRGPGNSSFQVLVNNTSSANLNFTDESVDAGRSYHYRVSAINEIGVGILSNEAFAQTPVGHPSQVRNLSIEFAPSGTNALLKWESPEKDGGAQIVEYRIEKRRSGTTSWSQVSTSSQLNMEFIVQNLQPFQFYDFRVTAYNTEASTISSTPLHYTLENLRTHCPLGYIPVPGNDHDIHDFCIMQFEAREGSDNETPISTPLGPPWTGRNLDEVRDTCQLHAAGADLVNFEDKFDLIRHEEWMHLASEIVQVEENFLGNDSCLKQGNTGATSVCSRNSGGLHNWDFSNVPPTWAYLTRLVYFFEEERQEIFDLVGNAWEWVYFKTLPNLTCDHPTEEEFDHPCLDAFELFTPDPTLSPPYSPQGLGNYLSEVNPTGGGWGVLKGGGFTSASDQGPGLYATRVVDPAILSPSAADSEIGFRCVYRPN